MATRARLAGRYTSAQDVALVIEGVFLGLFNEKYPIQDCITNGDQIWNDIEKTAFYLRQGLTLTDIGEAFKYIGDALAQLPIALDNCKNCEGVIQEFIALKGLFSDPFTFLTKSGLDILWHFRDITNDIVDAKNAWNSQNYEEFGRFIGMIIKIATNMNEPAHPKRVQSLLSIWN